MCNKKGCPHGRKGPENPRWKGGTWLHSKGYVMVHAPGHPACNARDYAPQHRKVFYDYHGFFPEDGSYRDPRHPDDVEGMPWDIHHWDDDKLHNEISNLTPLPQHEHSKLSNRRGQSVIRYYFIAGSERVKVLGRKGGLRAARNRRRRERAAEARRRARRLRRRRGGGADD